MSEGTRSGWYVTGIREDCDAREMEKQKASPGIIEQIQPWLSPAKASFVLNIV
ncbi:hypothetical protein ACFOUO_01790 [Salinithrix halophila]|uniref:Uncharacterized protein n=1 Tax=Salinithrix halophila TaxID=1485204 RepID=A0ABV8JFF2_9BACL